MTYEQAVEKVKENWDALRALQKATKEYEWRENTHLVDTPFGQANWDNPDLVWVYLTSNDEGYEGHQTQIGVNRAGTVVYEYQSHCSCNGYEDTHGGSSCPMPDDTTKTFELREVPKEWKIIIASNVEKMMTLLPK